MSTDVSQLRVEASGERSAPVVVLVHGSMDRSAGMLRLSRRLAAEACVIRYDRRGYGGSAAVGPPFAVADHVGDLAGVIEQHAPGGVAQLVFGHSFGGDVALGLAECRPDLVHAVAVYETPLSWLDWWPGTSAGGTAVGMADAADAAEAFMRRMIGDAVWERLPASTRQARRAEGAAMVEELIDLRRGAAWDGGRVTLPVLAIAGEQARPHHHRGMRTVAEMIRSADFVELPGAGHGAPNTHAAELAELLRSWVSGLAG